MKKLMTAVMISAVFMVSTAFANKNENTSIQAESAFKKEFSQATDVRWTKTENYYKAYFNLNNQVMMAFFTPEGDYLGVTRNIVSTQLPIQLQASVKNDYSEYWITDLFEYARTDSNGYFITLENADQVVTLQSLNGTSWSVYKKTKK